MARLMPGTSNAVRTRSAKASSPGGADGACAPMRGDEQDQDERHGAAYTTHGTSWR